MLMVAIRFDETVSRGASRESALKFMSDRPEVYQPRLINAIGPEHFGAVETEVRTIRLRDLKPNMIINEDLWAANGLLLVGKGQSMSEPVIARLLNFGTFAWNDRPFTVRVPVPRPVVTEPVPMATPSRMSAT